MQRRAISPRPDYLSRLESLGLTWHTHDDGQPYWREDAYYAFSMPEIETLENAVNTLQGMCLKAVEHVLAKNQFAPFGIPEFMIPLIYGSWERDEVSIYGRFDLAFDGKNPPKLLEYNADTPTSLVEAAVIQWYWLEERFPGLDQFNSIHERLVAAWKRAANYLPISTLYFLNQDTDEDHATVAYLRDTADQAGISTAQISVEDLGWNPDKSQFEDLDGRPVRAAFKLYPWEFMWEDEYAQCLVSQPRPCTFLEPAWKMLLSNKAILAILWELFPGHPNLLPAYLDGPRDMTALVKKPILAREGANVEIHTGQDILLPTEHREYYGAEGYIYQGYVELPIFDGFRPVIGAWVIDGESAGMGIRESRGPVTDNGSCFVPHLLEA